MGEEGITAEFTVRVTATRADSHPVVVLIELT
jgi:hypothetical protein